MKKNKKQRKNRLSREDRLAYIFAVTCMFGMMSFHVLSCQAVGMMPPAEYFSFHKDCVEIQENFIDLAEGALDWLSDEDEKRLVEQATGKKIK